MINSDGGVGSEATTDLSPEIESRIRSRERELNGIFKKIAYFDRSSNRIAESGDRERMSRQYSLLKTQTNEAQNIIQEIQGLKLDADEEEDEIDKWTDEFEGKLKPVKVSMSKLIDSIKSDEMKVKNLQREEEAAYHAELRAAIRKEEEKSEEVRRLRREEFDLALEKKKLQLAEKQKSQTRLPKLEISKFQGTYLDWTRFWSLFESQIDKTDVTSEAKFAYLKELVIPKVRAMIEKLPCSLEGYEKAKEFLFQKYGEENEVINAHVTQILSLPHIHGSSKAKIHEFYETLLGHVQALETMGKLSSVAGNVRMTLDKLDGIKSDLTRTDPGWKKWGFTELLQALHLWTERNPMRSDEREWRHAENAQMKALKRERNFSTRSKQQQWKPRACAYCDASDHKSSDCMKVTSIDDRRKILSNKRLCFNCTGKSHRANECNSRIDCQICHKKHHTSICDKAANELLTTINESKVVYPVVIVKVEGIKCRALLDTGSGNSYASSGLLELIKRKPIRQDYKRIEMMMQSTTKVIDIYNVKISDINEQFKIVSEVSKVDRQVLLTLPNPQYNKVLPKYSHLKDVKMDEEDTKAKLPIHLILGASDFSRIKTNTSARVGNDGEPVAEKTRFGWILISPGQELDSAPMMLTRSVQEDYMHLCSLDVLGLSDHPEGDQVSVHEEFKEQLIQREDGRYETSLPWKAGYKETLPSNHQLAKNRFQNLIKRLQKQPDLLAAYHAIIQEQLNEGIVERAPEIAIKPEHYIPHKPVVREKAESTKVRIVYDASASNGQGVPSLNECLDIGPPLQKMIHDILLRIRVSPIVLAGDIRQAFLQIIIRETERDALRFIWIDNLDDKNPVILRATRALFGLGPSPFLLGGTLEEHFRKYETKPEYEDAVEEIRGGTYVDDIHLCGQNVQQTADYKEKAITIFRAGGFSLHKWHSNVPELETSENTDRTDSTYAKESFGTKPHETKLLGVSWNKREDTISVTFPIARIENELSESTKREVLRIIASIYDPLGISSPVLLTGKSIFRESCDRKLGWDRVLPSDLRTKWEKWLGALPKEISIPRSLTAVERPVTSIEIHGFGDASLIGCCSVVYLVIYQGEITKQGFLTAKSRLSKRDLSIPRLELVASHMTSNLVDNVSKALKKYPITGKFGWTDSSVALHWIRGKGKYKQFVNNRVNKINEKQLTWRHVPTDENPADLGSRGAVPKQLDDLWKKGPCWLSDSRDWPTDIVTDATKESESESQIIKDIMKLAVSREIDQLDHMFNKLTFWKAIRVTAWIVRFVRNCRVKRNQRTAGPLRTMETNEQKKFWLRRAQQDCKETDEFKEDQQRLNLQLNKEKLYECRGRLQGQFPIYIPRKHSVSKKIVEDAHVQTLHGGVGLTMSNIREKYWIPKLRQLSKQTIRKCHGCKRFQARAFAKPPTGNLPKERTEGEAPFQVIGVDFAGPVYYKQAAKREGKS